MSHRHRSTAKQQICDEHLHLRELLNQLRHVLATRQTAPTAINILVRDLTQRVWEHFAHEEAGGYFSEAIEREPRLRQRAGELLREHSVMSAQLITLQEYAASGNTDGRWWKLLDEAFGSFFECFAAHEAAENTLLQKAYSEDIGAED